eukprot:g16360.t2
MKVRMAQSGVVSNSVMAFIKTSRRAADTDSANEQPNDAENSDMDIFDNNSEASDASDVSTVKGSKSINIKSGLVTEEGLQPSDPPSGPPADEAPGNPTPEAPAVPDETNTLESPRVDAGGATGDAAVSETDAEEDTEGDKDYDSSATFYSDDEYSSYLSLSSGGSEGTGSAGSLSTSNGSLDTSLSSAESTSDCDDDDDDENTSGCESHGHDSWDDSSSADMSGDDETGSCYSSHDGSEYNSSQGSENDSDGSGISYSSSSDAGSSSSSEGATSLVWESVSDGSSYTAYSSECGSDVLG